MGTPSSVAARARFTRRLLFALVAISITTSVTRASRGDSDTVDDTQFSADVIACEDALARLKECCPAFDTTRVTCHHHYELYVGDCSGSDGTSGGCGDCYPFTDKQEQEPAIDFTEALCIQNESCDALVAGGVCARAQSATAYVYGTQAHAPVCP
jgi:hypothetical protein